MVLEQLGPISSASLTGNQRALSASSPPFTAGSSPAGKSKWKAWVMVRPRNERSGWSNTCWPLIDPLSTGTGIFRRVSSRNSRRQAVSIVSSC